MEKLEICAAALRRHRFETAVVRNRAEAFDAMRRAVEAAAPATVAFGDSMTMRATGIVEWLRDDPRYRLLDGFDASVPRPERMEIRRQGLLSDLFVTGINALTEQGALYWLDMVGNRVAPVVFGPRKVILVAGRNKIVADGAAAEERIRTGPLRATWRGIPISARRAPSLAGAWIATRPTASATRGCAWSAASRRSACSWCSSTKISDFNIVEYE